jgi:malic enzyme
VLYFKLLADHLDELLPVVYDPTVGDAIEQWSVDYRDSRAVYLSIDRRDDVRASFESLGLGADDVDLIVVSDAQEILGIGDWGVNGTDISIGKLAVYTAAAGIDPNRVIAVNLDVGTDNEQLLNSPAYLGNRHARVTGKRYDDFIARYLQTASELFPNALLHFEDFGPSNARRILKENAESYRIFNDDVQGTGAIVLASVLSALKATKGRFAEQRLVVFGAGTAGTGIADQIHAAMLLMPPCDHGLTPRYLDGSCLSSSPDPHVGRIGPGSVATYPCGRRDRRSWGLDGDARAGDRGPGGAAGAPGRLLLPAPRLLRRYRRRGSGDPDPSLVQTGSVRP